MKHKIKEALDEAVTKILFPAHTLPLEGNETLQEKAIAAEQRRFSDQSAGVMFEVDHLREIYLRSRAPSIYPPNHSKQRLRFVRK
ncbi:hypothetical protein [Ruegeria arenilitoris]|uniref:hypothetical protein n=1 Tax=Ruegeria arenilitoris TaxID=1173585 RepID=UPI001C94AEAF|nr:hypothetical protein [Ruegeria arenilitoris]MBY6083190.1 hypothetical protein [Ruegeria arenilitoris]